MTELCSSAKPGTSRSNANVRFWPNPVVRVSLAVCQAGGVADRLTSSYRRNASSVLSLETPKLMRLAN